MGREAPKRTSLSFPDETKSLLLQGRDDEGKIGLEKSHIYKEPPRVPFYLHDCRQQATLSIGTFAF